MELILFGIAREIVGNNKLIIPSNSNVTTVNELKAWMKKEYPQLAALTSVAVAVNSRYAEDTEQLDADSEIAFIPPVSGG
jgi:sulfur-carrier protein